MEERRRVGPLEVRRGHLKKGHAARRKGGGGGTGLSGESYFAGVWTEQRAARAFCRPIANARKGRKEQRQQDSTLLCCAFCTTVVCFCVRWSACQLFGSNIGLLRAVFACVIWDCSVEFELTSAAERLFLRQ